MRFKPTNFSWVALAIFYLVLVLVVTFLDALKDTLDSRVWGLQIFLITIGVGILALVGAYTPHLKATWGLLLTFVVGILTIIPAVLMALGPIPGLWPDYFYITLGMASGSFMSFLFLRLIRTQKQPNQTSKESENKKVD